MDINIDFFKVSHEEKDKTIDSVLKEIKDLSFEERLTNIYKVPSRIQDIHNKNGLWYASILKIRMEDDHIPTKAKLTGEEEDIILALNEGIGEKVSFLYDPKHKIFVIQRNGHGIGANGLKYYLERIGKFSFHMEPVIEQHALDRLKHKDTIRRFEFKLIRPAGKIKEDIKGKSGFKALDLIDEFGSYYVDVKFGFDTSKPNKGKVLHKNKIISMANKIWGKDEEIVEKFRVYGIETDDEKPDFVDLIKDRIHETVTVEVSRSNRMTYTWMSDLIKAAYEIRRKEIILQYFEE